AESFAKSFAPVVEQINLSFMQFAQFQQAMIDTVQQSFAPAIKALATSLTDYVSSMHHVEFKVGQLFSTLPDLSEIGKRLDTYMKAADTIDAGGFPFLLRHWAPADLAPYAGIEKVDVR